MAKERIINTDKLGEGTALILPPSSEQLAEIHSQEIGGIDAAIANNQSRLRVE